MIAIEANQPNYRDSSYARRPLTPDTLTELLPGLYSMLRNFLRTKGTSFHDAEDVIQDTMGRICRASGTYDPFREIEPWAREIGMNLRRDQLRRESARSRATQAYLERQARWEDNLGRDGELEDERKRIISQLLTKLRKDKTGMDQREILELIYERGLTCAQTAAALGVSTGTVKSRLSRALDALRAAA